MSGSACKELESLCSVLPTSKKLNKLKNQQLCLDLQGSEDTGQNDTPQIGQTGDYGALQVTRTETAMRARAGAGKPEL